MKKNENIKVLTGNEACALGALAAGMRFYAGYPITPSSEIAEILAEELPKHQGVFIQMEDEIASIAAIIGGSLTGAKTMTATSGPGFSLMQENIGYAIMAEVPTVIVNVMRGGPSTGLPTMPSQGDVMQARWGTHGDHQIIALAPHTVRETFDMTVEAFNLAEKYRTPVIMLFDEILGHVSEKVILPAKEELPVVNRVRPDGNVDEYLPYDFTESKVPPMADFGSGYRYHVTGLVHDETGFPTNNSAEVQKQLLRLEEKITLNVDDIVSVEEYMMDDAEIGLISYGSSARSARYAIKQAREAGIKIGMIRFKTMWPFPTKFLEKYTSIKNWLVVEMNNGQIAHEVEWALGKEFDIRKFTVINGEPINPMDVLAQIQEIAHV